MNYLCSRCVNRNANKFCKAGRPRNQYKNCAQFEAGVPHNRLAGKRIKKYENNPIIKEMRADMAKYI